MKEAILEIFTSGDIWSIVIKVLITAACSALLGLAGTLIGKLISKNKESKIYKYAKTCVEAAEMKFPNEGRKMGPEKMAYVMDQLAIKFPKVKESTYFYNIAEAAVLELNKELQQAQAIKDFEEKYGEKPLAVLEEESKTTEEEMDLIEDKEEIADENLNSAPEVKKSASATSQKIKSF